MFKKGDVIQYVGGYGSRFVVRLVDPEIQEAFAENLDGGQGTRIINSGNWKKIGVLENGEVVVQTTNIAP